MTTNSQTNILHRTVAAIVRRRLARVLVVLAVAAAIVPTVSAAADPVSAAGPASAASSFNPIRNAGTGGCLDVRKEDDYYRSGARIQQWKCSGAQEQNWRAVQIGSIDGYNPTWEIVSQRSGLCLARPGARVDGDQALQLPCDGSRRVAWYIGNLQNGYHDVVSIVDGRLLDLDHQSAANGAKVQLWSYNLTFAQQWQMTLPPAF